MILDIRDFLRSSKKSMELPSMGGKHMIFKGRNSLFLVPRLCPHYGIPLSRTFVDGDVVICRWHGCRFSLTPNSDFPESNILKSEKLEVKNGKVEIPE